MKIIDCYEVTGNTDTTEGRGPLKVVARFSTKEAAEGYVKSKAYAKWCVMGYQSESDLSNIKSVRLIILDTANELADLAREETKARALAKLTVEEREVLGL